MCSSWCATIVVQALVGHGSPAMTRHYTHIDVESVRHGIEQISSYESSRNDKEKIESIKDLAKTLNASNADEIKLQILEIIK